MRVLLDTHALLWWSMERGARLSDRAREVIADASTEALVSAASLYEIAVKAAIGRIELPGPPETYLDGVMRRNRFASLPVEQSHALRAGSLPLIHRDPWDRLLIGQAQIEGLSIVTADPAIGRYEVEVIW